MTRSVRRIRRGDTKAGILLGRRVQTPMDRERNIATSTEYYGRWSFIACGSNLDGLFSLF